MDASRTLAIAIAALALLALSVAATTLETAPAGPSIDSTDSDPIDTGEGRSYPGRATATEAGDSSAEWTERATPTNDSAPDGVSDGGVSPMVVLAALVAVGLVAVALVLRSTDDEPPGEQTDPSTNGDGSPEPPGAGHERSVAATNDVYRAWCRFEAEIDERVSPGTTPADLVERATVAGYPEKAVRDLCGAYCDVRYGDEPVTEDRARRAREAIERIERGGT